MKKIKLSQGEFTLVDDDDFEYLSQFKWYCRRDRNTSYAVRKSSPSKTVLMHRVIMKTPDNLLVDHIDHNGLNNQKNNLRNCSKTESQQNRRTWSNSGYLGVHICIRAAIQVNGKCLRLGTFKTIKEAAIAYDNAAKKHFGEFANLNFKE